DLIQIIKNKQIKVSELMEIHLSRIQLTNEKVNAIVSLNEDYAMEEAKKLDEKIANNNEFGQLIGLPIVIKDTHNAKGYVTTYGSRIFKNNMAQSDEIAVARLRKAGAIVIGKSNVPEFSAGAHTFNNLF